jgi:hypothetical protein
LLGNDRIQSKCTETVPSNNPANKCVLSETIKIAIIKIPENRDVTMPQLHMNGVFCAVRSKTL